MVSPVCPEPATPHGIVSLLCKIKFCAGCWKLLPPMHAGCSRTHIPNMLERGVLEGLSAGGGRWERGVWVQAMHARQTTKVSGPQDYLPQASGFVTALFCLQKTKFTYVNIYYLIITFLFNGPFLYVSIRIPFFGHAQNEEFEPFEPTGTIWCSNTFLLA